MCSIKFTTTMILPFSVSVFAAPVQLSQAAEPVQGELRAAIGAAPAPNPRPIGEWCDTHRAWVAKRPIGGVAGAVCQPEGLCDDPSVRDMSIPSANTPIKTIRVHFVILRESNGTNAAGTVADAAAQIDQMNADFAPYRFFFLHTASFADDSAYRHLTTDRRLDIPEIWSSLRRRWAH
jgi:hypothetical protein